MHLVPSSSWRVHLYKYKTTYYCDASCSKIKKSLKEKIYLKSIFQTRESFNSQKEYTEILMLKMLDNKVCIYTFLSSLVLTNSVVLEKINNKQHPFGLKCNSLQTTSDN
jgi:hypothetical protein